MIKSNDHHTSIKVRSHKNNCNIFSTITFDIDLENLTLNEYIEKYSEKVNNVLSTIIKMKKDVIAFIVDIKSTFIDNGNRIVYTSEQRTEYAKCIKAIVTNDLESDNKDINLDIEDFIQYYCEKYDLFLKRTRTLKNIVCIVNKDDIEKLAQSLDVCKFKYKIYDVRYFKFNINKDITSCCVI